MAELLWPEEIVPNRSEITVQDSVGISRSTFTAFTQSIGRPGSRLKMSMSVNGLKARRRAQIHALLAGCRGGTHSIRCRDHSYVQAGSFSGGELVPNPTFASVTGYTVGTSNFAGVLSDRSFRLTRVSNSGGTDGVLRLSSAASVTALRLYVGRILVFPGRGPANGFGLRFGSTSFGTEYANLTSLQAGLLSLAFVPYDATAHFGLSQGAVSGFAGDYFEVQYFSLAPCALIDNGANYLPWSSDLANAAWTKTRSTVPTTPVTLPDGSSGTVNTLHEDATAADSHFIEDSVTVGAGSADFCYAVAAKAENRSWLRLVLNETSGNSSLIGHFDVTNGVKGTLSAGTNWASARDFMFSLGNGWYLCAIVGRKTNAATTLDARLVIAEADNDFTFNGLNQDSLYVWRPSVAISGVPMRLTGTAGTAFPTGQVQNQGGGLHTKGWHPVSTNGLLLRGDQVEIGGQLLILDGPVNCDAAGRAWLPIPSIRRAPADNEPVIVTRPMGKWIPEEPENGWTNVPGLFSDAELVLGEAG